MPPRTGHIPRISYHRGAQRYYVTLDGKETYFASYKGPKRSRPPAAVVAEYDRTIQRWQVRRLDQPRHTPSDPAVSQLAAGYLAFAETYYVKRGKQTSEVDCIRSALRVLCEGHGGKPASDFGPLALKEVRGDFVRQEWTRETVNKQVSRVRRMFRWAAENELVPASVHQALQAVRDLSKGRSPAPEGKGVKAVSWSVVRPVLGRKQGDVPKARKRWLARPLSALVRVHYLLGCRAQDAVLLRGADIDRTADPEGRLWKWTPSDEHGATWKTEHHGGEPLAYWIGPRAQRILRRLIDWDHTEDWAFPTKGKKGNGRRAGRYSTASYRRAVTRGLERLNADRAARGLAELPYWFPLQLRHARLTRIRRHAGLEAAQAVAQHQQLTVTQVYAEKHEGLARKAMRDLG